MDRWRGLADAVSEADGVLSFGESGPARAEFVGWALSHQAQKGRASGLFQPTAADFDDRRLVTGERLKTKLATTHVLSQESARIVHKMKAGDRHVDAAVALTAARLRETCYALQHCTIGECAASFIGYVRFLWGTQGEKAAPEVTWRLRTLSEHRDGTGRWKRFPTYYTLLVLSEVQLPSARDEIAYAEPAWSSQLRVAPAEEPFAGRRRRLLKTLAARG